MIRSSSLEASAYDANDTVTEVSPLAALRCDARRYVDLHRHLPGFVLACKIALKKELWVIALFRLGCWIRQRPRWIALLLKIVWVPLNELCATLVDIHIANGARVGPGLYIGHQGGIWISPTTTLGARCNVSQGVVIGRAGRQQGPTLGDRVWLGPHAVVTGPVRVGNACVVGANSLVVSDLPDKAVAIGVPAKILSYAGSDKLING